ALLSAFAAVALILAAIGIYGVMAVTTALRTREMGIRMALGASPGSVLGLVVRQGMLPVAAGIVVGAAGGLVAARALASFLFEVGTTDPVTFGLTATLLASVALAACWLPARRALRIAPATLIRSE